MCVRNYSVRWPKTCEDTFMFKKEEVTTFSKWIDHIKLHYLDKDLVSDEVILLSESDS
jgi:hypothetical protein